MIEEALFLELVVSMERLGRFSKLLYSLMAAKFQLIRLHLFKVSFFFTEVLVDFGDIVVVSFLYFFFVALEIVFG